MKERKDDYLLRKKHLENMTDAELKRYFYELADKIVDPLLKLSYENTTKSIERSVLLRMGFSSIQAKEIVDKLHEHNLLSKGSGHCIFKLSKHFKISLQEAGNRVFTSDGIDFLKEVFKND